jgi:hypothetical protein
MKRLALRLLLGCALLGGALSVSACSCTPQSAERSAATPAAPSGAVAPAVGDAAAKETVYVTDGGKRYHRVGCRSVKKRGKVAITVKQAREQGYTPCSVCDPPQ